MTRSSAAVPALPGRLDEPLDDEEEEEGAGEEEDEDVAGQGAGSDPDSDAGGGGGDEEEVEEEVIEEVEVEVEEGEEEEEEDGDNEDEADGGEEGVEEGQEVEVMEEEEGDEEDAAGEVAGEGEHEGGEKEEEQGGGGGGAAEGVNGTSQQIKSEGHVEGLKLLHPSANKSETSSKPNSLVGGDAFSEMKTSVEALEPVKNGHVTLGDCRLPSTGDSVSTDKQEPLYSKEKELVRVTQKRCRNSDLDGILHLEKEATNFDRQAYSQATNLEPNSLRPKSPMAGFLENNNKKPAVVCSFFARGWCIKGNSCRFLHQPDGVDASQESKEYLVGLCQQNDSKEDTGLKHEVDRLYTSGESLTSTAESSASESLQRALVRAYGCHGLQTDSSLGTNAQNIGVQCATANSDLFPDRHRTNYAEIDKIQRSGCPSYGSEKLDSHFNSIDGGLPMTGDFFSRKYLGEGKQYHGLSKLESTYNESFSRGSPVAFNSFIPEIKHCSSSSLMYSSMYQRTDTPHSNDISSADPLAQYQGLPSLHDSVLYHAKGLLNSSFHSPLSQVSHSSSSFTQNAFHHNHGSIPLGTEDLGNHKRLDYEIRYHGSRSSSPFSQFGPEKFQGHGIAESTSVSAENKVQSSRDAWEPSMPFRSSFYCPPAKISSPASQYDPLSDSIEPFKATPPSLLNQDKSIDHVLRRSHSPGYNDTSFPTSFRNSGEPLLSKSNSEYGTSVYPSLNATVPGSGALDETNRSSLLKEKSWSPGHAIDAGNMKEMDYENNPMNQEDKGRHSRETKALKNFRACLVEFVKDLVKPAWRGGHLSKDAHKMVVKKAAEKVLSALQPHQIPSSMDAINQYLSASRPKIVKLVEGYVDKYSKS